MQRFKSLNCQPQKIVKQIQTICRQQPTNCLSVYEHFVGLALKGLISKYSVQFPLTLSISAVILSMLFRIVSFILSIVLLMSTKQKQRRSREFHGKKILLRKQSCCFDLVSLLY